MDLTWMHLLSLTGTIVFVVGCGIYFSRSVKSADGFSLGGRSSGVKMVAGSIAGISIGGGATIGTAQMAFTIGLSAWWFTLGMGIGFVLLGLFYARPLRNSALETIPQYLVLNYGKSAGPIVSIISSAGIFFSCVSSVLPGILMISAVLHISSYTAAFFLMLLIIAYVYFGGMKSASVSGFLKSIIIWLTLFIAGCIACADLAALPDFQQIFAASHWFSLFGNGVEQAWASLFSLIVGVICSQGYIQSLFSAADAKTASIGAMTAAAITIPVGLPSVAVAMFMHVHHPEILPILVLPAFLIEYLPPVIGGIALGGIMISIISSTAGQALSIGTMIARDIAGSIGHITDGERLLWVNRCTILLTAVGVAVFAIFHLDSQVLTWNYLSMALRGGGIFLPLSIAIFKPHFLSPTWAAASMVLSTLAALTSSSVFHIPLTPLFVGLIVSAAVIVTGVLVAPRIK